MGYRLPFSDRPRRKWSGQRRKHGRGFGVMLTFAVFVLFALVATVNLVIRQPQLFRPSIAAWTSDAGSLDTSTRLLEEEETSVATDVVNGTHAGCFGSPPVACAIVEADCSGLEKLVRAGGCAHNCDLALMQPFYDDACKKDDDFNLEEVLLGCPESDCAIHDDEGTGHAIMYMAMTLYFFLGIAIVCDNYFEPSLEKISEVLDLSEDVAGATFMAAGSSAPELFTSMGDTFGPANSIGIGTIVGSAMFNILVIVALSAAVANGDCNIDWRPVARDVFFYSSSVFMLVFFFQEDENGDTAISTAEAAIMVLGYFGYIVFMVFNQKVFSKCEKKAAYTVNPVDTDALAVASKAIEGETSVQKVGGDDAPSAGGADGDDDEDDGPFWIPPEGGPAGKVLWFFALPFELVYFLTIPAIHEQRCGCSMEGWYVVAFVMSIGWIGVLCHFMVEWASAIGCICGISPVVMGVTVLSIGTSVPDAIGSMIVAKNGQADMAIANAIGSNVFDVLLGLGFPWLLFTLIKGKDFPVDAGGLSTAIIILLSTVALFVGALFANRWKMNKQLGVMLFILYLLYVAYTLYDALVINPEEPCEDYVPAAVVP